MSFGIENLLNALNVNDIDQFKHELFLLQYIPCFQCNGFIIVDNYNSTDGNNYYGITAFMYVNNVKPTFSLISYVLCV